MTGSLFSDIILTGSNTCAFNVSNWCLSPPRERRLTSSQVTFVFPKMFHGGQSKKVNNIISDSDSSPSSRKVLRENVSVRLWLLLLLLLLYYSLCGVGRSSRDNPQTGAEVTNVQGKLCQLAYSSVSHPFLLQTCCRTLHNAMQTFPESLQRY